MKVRIICLLYCLLSAVILPAQNPLASFPSFDEIRTHFQEHYSEDLTYWNKLARRSSGWYILQMDYQNQEVKHEILYWSPGKGYEELDFAGPQGNGAEPFSAQSYDKYGFSRCAYYGYDGWEKDMIRDFGNKKRLGDTMLEGLARAYSSYGRSLLLDQDKISSYVQVPEWRADSFVVSSEKALQCMERLMRQNPRYRVLVGSIRQKYANEHMDAHDNLAIAGWPGKGKRFIKPGLYDTNTMVMAENLMASFDSNAIAITYGDNDHYTLRYLQLQQGIRTDIRVINSSLLGADWYLAYQFTDKSLNWRFMPGRLENKLDIVDMNPEGKECAVPGQFWASLSRMQPSQRYNGFIMSKYGCVQVTMPDGDTLNLDLVLGAKYMYKYEMAMLDLFLANTHRPFYMTHQADDRSSRLFNRYMTPQGLVSRVKRFSDMDQSTADALLSYFRDQYKPYDYNDISITDNQVMLESVIRTAAQRFMEVCLYYESTQQVAKAKEVLEIWVRHTPANSRLHAHIIPSQINMQLRLGYALNAEERCGQYLEMLNQDYQATQDELDRKDMVGLSGDLAEVLEQQGMGALLKGFKKQYPVLFPEM